MGQRDRGRILRSAILWGVTSAATSPAPPHCRERRPWAGIGRLVLWGSGDQGRASCGPPLWGVAPMDRCAGPPSVGVRLRPLGTPNHHGSRRMDGGVRVPSCLAWGAAEGPGGPSTPKAGARIPEQGDGVVRCAMSSYTPSTLRPAPCLTPSRWTAWATWTSPVGPPTKTTTPDHVPASLRRRSPIGHVLVGRGTAARVPGYDLSGDGVQGSNTIEFLDYVPVAAAVIEIEYPELAGP